MNIVKWFATFIVMLALTGFVMAETNDTNATQGQALSVRYDHMLCKVTFTNTQIDLFKQYTTADLTSDKTNLLSDMAALKVFVTNIDKSGFDTYLDSTAKAHMHNATQDLNEAKKNFKQYNLTNETKTEFIGKLKDAKAAYSACVDDKEVKMARVAEIHLNNWNRQLEKIQENMNKKNISTENMTQILADITARNAKLKELIDAGNITAIRDFMKTYQESQYHFAARFEIARLEGYRNKLQPLADRYNMTDALHDIDERIANAGQFAQEGRKYNEGERKQVWEDLKSAGKDMQQAAKDINTQRINERERNGTRQDRPPRPNGPRAPPENLNNSADSTDVGEAN